MELAHSGYLVPLEYVNMNPFFSSLVTCTESFPELLAPSEQRNEVQVCFFCFIPRAFVLIDCLVLFSVALLLI